MISTVIRTTILYIVVTVAIRLMGKRQIGDMQPNELVVTLLISEIAAIPLQDTNQPVLSGIAAISCLVILEIIVSVLIMKSIRIRKIMSGKSVVIIKNGVIDQHAMKDVRMTVLDLVELLRGQNVFDISQVDYAILEVNGDLSVLMKGEYETIKLNDMNIPPKSSALPLPVISDGKVLSDSLNALQITNGEFNSILKSKSVKASDVFLMTVDRVGNINLIKKR